MAWLGADTEAQASHHVQIFIPELDRDGDEIPRGQDHWVEACLELLGELFGGATAFPPGRGVWRDYETGKLLFENTVIVFSYVAEEDLTREASEEARVFLDEMGRVGRQGEVGILIDGTYVGIRQFGHGEETGDEQGQQ